MQTPSLIDLYVIRKYNQFVDVLRPPQNSATAASTRKSSYGSYNNWNGGSSLSKSPRFDHAVSASFAPAAIVNRRDMLGRTALMLAISNTEAESLNYVSALLACSSINVNLQDHESGWTALHRALYHGNMEAARMLTARSDCDVKIKDFEGLTPIDLFNSTVDGTNPDRKSHDRLELFTWGSNRNFVLGTAGDGDRIHPERVNLRTVSKRGDQELVGVADIVMSKLHTAILTTESSGNVRFCGYGGGARLGASGKAQFAFEPLPDFPYKVTHVALGLDHTVLLTDAGDVYTYGLNHHAQLGYPIDNESGKTNEPMQLTPRKVIALKREQVLGIAASRYHTAVYTADALFTWGGQRGQLGYGSGAVQVLPRQVTAVQTAILQLVAVDHATVCLLENFEVLVLFRSTSFRMTFPMNRFPTGMQVYRPPAAKIAIARIAGGGSDLVAVSSIGDVFHWTLDDRVVDTAQAARSPIRLWDLRRKFTAVVDAAVANESIILCTRSGHVFVRQRRADTIAPVKGSDLKGSSGLASHRKNFKFSRLPHAQRIVKVCANGHGGFAAIRSDATAPALTIEGTSMGEDLLALLPHWHRSTALPALDELPEADGDDDAIDADVAQACRLFSIMKSWDQEFESHLHGTDMYVCVDKKRVPIHRTLLMARSPILRSLLLGQTTSAAVLLDRKRQELTFSKTSYLTVLLLLHYIYSDDFPCLWDPRAARKLQEIQEKPRLSIIRDELQRLAHILQLPYLARACGSLEKQENLFGSLWTDTANLLAFDAEEPDVANGRDLVLSLADGKIACHSVILRARCPFFAALFDNPVWLSERANKASNARTDYFEVDMRHLETQYLQPVLSFVYSGASAFEIQGFSQDQRIDFLSAILAISNELLLDELKLVCSRELTRLVDLRTVSAILQDAITFEAASLADSCCSYVIANMETILEGHYLQDLDPSLVQRLAAYCQRRQQIKSPISRNDESISLLLAKHIDWLADVDIARPPTGITRRLKHSSKSPRFSPTLLPTSPPPMSLVFADVQTPTKKSMGGASPLMHTDDDEMFQIDDLDLNAGRPDSPDPTQVKSGWRAVSAAPVTPSLKDIMARQEGSRGKSGNVTPSRSSIMSSQPVTPLTALSNAIRNTESGSPSWRKVEPANRISLGAIQSEQGSLLKKASAAQPMRRTASDGRAATVSPPSTSKTAMNPASAVGAPIISPIKSAGPVPSTRNRLPGQDGVWVNYASTQSFPTEIPTGLVADDNATASSFAAIQNAQRDEGESIRNARKAPKSLAEIQEREAEIREQEAFEAWFAEEQRRFLVTQQAEQVSSNQRGRGQKKPRGRGRPNKTSTGVDATRTN